MVTPVGLLIVEDHEQVRTALVRRLGRMQEVRVLAAAANARAAVRLIEELRPDVVLCEPRAAGDDPLAGLRRLAAVGAPVVVWTCSLLPGERESFMQAGAAAVLVKDTHLTSLVATLCSLVTGQYALSAPIRPGLPR
jgi:DNA-binding NarL/FixJ family response regulator